MRRLAATVVTKLSEKRLSYRGSGELQCLGEARELMLIGGKAKQSLAACEHRLSALAGIQKRKTTMTTVSKIMTRDVKSLAPSDTVSMAAKAMSELNVGSIPVCEGGKLVGIVTDRDMVVRALAKGKDATTTMLADIMSSNVCTIKESDDMESILEEMSQSQIRRLPVVDAAGALVGIVSLGDIATKSVDEEADVGESLAAISAPAQPDRA